MLESIVDEENQRSPHWLSILEVGSPPDRSNQVPMLSFVCEKITEKERVHKQKNEESSSSHASAQIRPPGVGKSFGEVHPFSIRPYSVYG